MGMKFIRGMIYPNANANGRGIGWRLKWAYEFWGFCVNGIASATTPGGFAATTGVNMPTNFTGGTSLMASGSDGSHPAVAGDLFSGDCVFTSPGSVFSPSMVGKALVMWKPNSDSSEDSIYLITRVLNTTQLQININTGGTPNPTTKHPSVTARTGVFFRVVDMEAGGNALLTGNHNINGSHLVFETAAGTINPGQANSQIAIVQQGVDQGALIGVGIGGTGSWQPTTFTITAATNANPIVVTTASPHGLTTGQTINISGGLGNTNVNGLNSPTVLTANTFSIPVSGNGTYTANSATLYSGFINDGYNTSYTVNPNTSAAYTSGQTAITMIADKTFYINHIREQDLFQGNYYSNWHFEIPTRLYPQGQDLHPVAVLVQTFNTGSLTTTSTTASYGGGWVMRTHSGDPTTARAYRTLVKSMQGDGVPNVFGSNLSDYRVGYNTIAGTVPVSDGVLGLPGVSNQFQFARVKLRTVKFTGTHIPKHHRIGLNGEIIQLVNGICWPWDNTIIPFQLLLFGN